MKEMIYGKCTVCGHDLIAGVNWFTMKRNHVCTDCSGHPVYPAPVFKAYPDSFEAMEVAEGLILAQQDERDI